MNKISFNDNWKYYRVNEEGNSTNITIPHDAMIHENRSHDSAGGLNISWFEAYDYVYEKDFFVPQEYADKIIFLEFEGVYHNAEIHINDKKVFSHDNGYIGFHVEITAFIDFETENNIKVIVKNSKQPNSRWYTGAGIYRPVTMVVSEKEHIAIDGVKIRTISVSPAIVEISIDTTAEGDVSVSLYDDGDQTVYTFSGYSKGMFSVEAAIDNARLWSPGTPTLYRCRVEFKNDSIEEMFGIRKIQCDSSKGFCINDERTILRGACIHHDNGLLGACAYDDAEERKIRILKEGGYNAIRSAHNPCSKALLDACDRLGMLVMDEYADMWYIHKTRFDYATQVESNYRQDLKAMIDKDYNHPSVIMYSIGNEVSETSEKRGIELCGKMADYCHQLDNTRPVTCGVNIFFNYLYSLGFGVYSDKKAEKNKHVGSAFFNYIAGIVGDKFMKLGATLNGCDRKTREAFEKLDVAGYNYGILRYEKDMKKYPDRVIVGTETFCRDAYKFYEMAKKHPALIGDFVWAGMDYLGEVGTGAWEYKEYAPEFNLGVGWMTAGSGRIDITGNQTAELAYTRVAFELDKINIAVRPVSISDKRHSPSAWKMTNAVQSWSWNGYNGKKTKIEVYTRAYKAALYINDKCVGVKRTHKDCRVIYSARYYDGEIVAVALDKENNEIARTSLKTALHKTVLTLKPEKNTYQRRGLCVVNIRLTDENGVVKPFERADVKVSVKGGTLLGLGNGCSYNKRGYLTDVTDTYYGQALAIIKPDSQSEKIIVNAESNYGANSIEIKAS
jgi:beta-galactosidase